MCSTRCAPKPTPPESRKRNLPKPTRSVKTNFSTPSLTHSTRAPMKSTEANAIDMQKSAEHGMDAGKLDRLKFDVPRATQPHKVCAT